MAVEIPLSKGKVTLVDEADYEKVSQHKWYAANINGAFYARTNIKKEDGKGTTISLHRFLLNPPGRMQIDHINGNSLDNRRDNLRLCTHGQNQCNKYSKKGTSSPYKGVKWHKRDKIWYAVIRLNNKQFYLGSYHDELKAAHAYDEAARKLHKEFARLNFPRPGEQGAH